MNDYIKVTKRENNTKRNFLILNENQCKHVPCDPSKAFVMFDELYKKLYDIYKNDKILFIGFAETATAIGFYIAEKFNMPYITTTREYDADKDYIYFQEVHSHASDQRIDKDFLDKMVHRIDRIIFIEDEVSTGSTILNGVSEITTKYPKLGLKFSVASIVNGMSDENKGKYKGLNIDLFYLIDKPVVNYSEYLSTIKGDGNYVETKNNFKRDSIDVYKLLYRQKQNKGINNIKDFMFEISEIANSILYGENDEILVLGTEEFMYPAIYVANMLKELGYNVVSHSTTRSPICVDNDKNYPLHTRYAMQSVYGDYISYVYDLKKYDKVIVVTDYTRRDHLGYLINALNLAGNIDNISVIKVEYEYNKVTSSYDSDDVVILLKDLTGKIEPESTEEREKKIQSGIHYSEMLPLEYKPTKEYLDIYNKMLELNKQVVADAVARLSDKLYDMHGDDLTVVSLARAGLPIGVLIKRYIRNKYNVNISHYTVSIIRGKGIDKNAIDYILEHHFPDKIQFVDGWTGKGAINNQLKEALKDYSNISDKIAVIADPANITDICGTHEDILIPSSCLNSTVSGLLSRTILRDDLVGKNEFHGVVYNREFIKDDLSMEFIDTIESCFNYMLEPIDTTTKGTDKGIHEVSLIKSNYNVKDVNFVKPGIGETTRVLLRRVPDLVLINEKNKDDIELKPIIQLAKDKNVNIEYINLIHYKCCGIIKNLADA